MVALNYARDVRIGDKPARAVALGSNFVWPALPERLFFRGQSMVYDFANKRYGTRLPDDTIDYTTNINDLGILTRASTATYWGPEGSLLEAAVDEARIQHDPVTGEPLGLLVESGATNNYARAADPSWSNCDPVEFIHHDRFINAYKVTAPVDERSGNHTFTWNNSTLFPSDGTVFSFSVTVKRLTDNIRDVWLGQRGTSYFPGATSRSIFSFEDETFTDETSTSYEGVVENLGDGYFRITRIGRFDVAGIGIAFTNESGATSFENDALRELIIADIQVSPATYPTSYIPTIGSPVTRAADDASIDLSDVFNPDEGTYVVRAVVKNDGGNEYFAGWYDGTIATPRLSIQRHADGVFSFRAGNRYISIPPPDHLRSGDVVTLAIAYNEGQITAAGFGEASTSSSDYSPASSINLVRGTGTSFGDNNRSLESSGIIAGFEYYPRALSEEELSAITGVQS